MGLPEDEARREGRKNIRREQSLHGSFVCGFRIRIAEGKKKKKEEKKRKKTHQNQRCRQRCPGPAGPQRGSGCTGQEITKTAPFHPFFPAQGCFFWLAGKHSAGERSPVPPQPGLCLSQLTPKSDLFPGFIPQPPRRGFSSVPTKPYAGRGDFYRLGAIFFPLFPYF